VKAPTLSTEASAAPELGPLRAPTFVDHVVEAIVSRAVLGKFLPGGRINELALAKELRVSRAPIREALRMLVAVGVVENTPYQGMRLAPLTPERVRQINEVRLELEKLALREICAGKSRAELAKALQNALEDMKTAARKEDRLALATVDADFHEAMMRASGNPVLLKLWQMLRPQLVIIFGLAETKKALRKIVDEHRTLLNGLLTLNFDKAAALMEQHIMEDSLAVDFPSLEAAINREARKPRRSAAK
jgi:DNA-binding GntR family transcriptional regulator